MSKSGKKPITAKIGQDAGNVTSAATSAALNYVTEKDFLASIIELAQAHNWKVTHFRPGMTSRVDRSGKPIWVTPVQADGKGFPDLVLARDGQLLFVEAKSEKGKPSEDQLKWFRELSKVAYSSPRVEVFCWKPSDWPSIEEMLE
mgnify:FL=1